MLDSVADMCSHLEVTEDVSRLEENRDQAHVTTGANFIIDLANNGPAWLNLVRIIVGL